METITSLLNVNGLSLSGLELLIRITLLLSVASLAAVLLRYQSAALRRLIWVGAFSLILLIPLLSVALPKIPLLATEQDTTAAIANEIVGINNEAKPLNKLEEINNSTGVNHEAKTNVEVLDVPADNSSTITPGIIENSGQDSLAINLELSLFLLWAMGFVFFSLRLLRHTLMARALFRRSQALNMDDPLYLFTQNISRENRISLYSSDELSTPIALGIIRPSVVLPADYISWSRSKQESAILHELGHINNADSFTRILAYISCTIYWFHPLAWYGFRKLKEEQEKSADNFVLDKGVAASTYAQDLLDIVKTIQSKQLNSGVMTAMGSYSFFPQRMRSILSTSQSRRGLSRGQTTITLLALIAIATVLAIFSARPDAQQTNSEDRSEIQQTINALENELELVRSETKSQTQTPEGKQEKIVDLETEIKTLKENLPTTPEIEEFTAINKAWSQAFAAGDLDKLMEFYAEDAVAVTPDKTYRGKNEIRRYFGDMAGSGVNITMDINSVDVKDNQATEIGTYHVTINEGIDLTLSGDYQAQWRKQNGRWLITEDESHMPDLSPIGDYVAGFIGEFVDNFDFDFDFDFDRDRGNIDFSKGQKNYDQNRGRYSEIWANAKDELAKASKEIEREMKFAKNQYSSNRRNREDTALNAAASNGHKDVVKMLLEGNIDVDKTGANGNTPLYSAAENGHKAIVKMLLDEGADPNVSNASGLTPLYSASKNGHSDIVKLLIKGGANIDSASNN
ncbi:hypothetical protein NBRC116493_04120 [Aurantivibrio infirmus]